MTMQTSIRLDEIEAMAAAILKKCRELRSVEEEVKDRPVIKADIRKALKNRVSRIKKHAQ
jgi:hypothetical protein